MHLNFTKMQGIGNDYIYLNCLNCNYNGICKHIPRLSNRNFGVGSDGVIMILPSKIADFKMRIFNADGSEAQMCGNGIRCVAKYVYENGLINKEKISIETLAGVKELELLVENNVVKEIKVDMGKPQYVKDYKKQVKVDKEIMTLNCISMGNPHAVTFVEDVDNIDIEKIGPIIENNIIFPNRTNVEFVQILDRNNIKMRVWERGAKETLACGTGACASTVACVLEGYTNNNITVHLLGGDLKINWNRETNHIFMTGPAEFVFEGTIKL